MILPMRFKPYHVYHVGTRKLFEVLNHNTNGKYAIRNTLNGDVRLVTNKEFNAYYER
jgi:hypothetical protein